MVLGLGEAHAVLLRIAVLVWEDDHEVLAREIFLQFVGQALEGVLVRDGAFTGGDDDEHVVFLNGGSQLWQFIPMGHRRIFRTYVGMAIVDILSYQYERLLTAMELDATIQLSCKTAQTFQPAMETGFKLCS